MIGYPKCVIINDERFDINTDFKVAIRCEEIAQDKTIGDTERALAIVYLLFGEKGLNSEYLKELLEKGRKYLACGKELKPKNENPDMDFIEDYSYIKTSFRSDYNINIDKEELHWWEFYDLLNGLSNSEFGNCCVLNRIRNIRNYDLKNISDPKERQKMREAKEQVALKKYKPKKKEPTEEQKQSAIRFYKSLKL